ncbi:MAG TPA: DUF4180 domain-containing protein [Bacteroidales bacterium]|nr:DUF4180 domain-containing protein [Bacteroidales bacterium]
MNTVFRYHNTVNGLKAGEISQKFSNYRMKLAIIGDFSETGSKSLNDFIRESNRGGTICFVKSLEEGLSMLHSR